MMEKTPLRPSVATYPLFFFFSSVVEEHSAVVEDVCGGKEGRNPVNCQWIHGPIIVGAGPSGLAVSACLKQNGIPFLILERSNCVASLWQEKTYDRLKLHLPTQFCQLPFLCFPEDFPRYPTKQQFISYMESYATHFSIQPRFKQAVERAELIDGFWMVFQPRTFSLNNFSIAAYRTCTALNNEIS
ncbi:unnamed protein product [Fraxinus pennsylvanica]|uniref:indole-3-pyruvate monooxygenase n=1 Tax=Fraxinus pennsylvanica TaxID=56036 RepID=A0AAD2AB32_9LAMI|nr:unnamed protein product [Fraxinus pennsylvanica]